jgi:hypothetical protein
MLGRTRRMLTRKIHGEDELVFMLPEVTEEVLHFNGLMLGW